jgi:hypothetical protein
MTKPKRRADITLQTVDDEAVVLDIRNDAIHQLNKTAHWILHHCDGSLAVAGIARKLAAEFDVDLERAVRDVTNAVSQLRQLELIE